MDDTEIDQSGGGGGEPSGPMGPPALAAERETGVTGSRETPSQDATDPQKPVLSGDVGDAGSEAHGGGGQDAALAVEQSASNHSVIEQPLPPPKGRGSAMGIDASTAIAVGVVIGGLAIVAWMRGRAARPRTSAVGAVRTAASGDDVEQTAIALAALVREADARIVELTRLREEIAAMGASAGVGRTPQMGGGDAIGTMATSSQEPLMMGRATHGNAAAGTHATLGTDSSETKGTSASAKDHAETGACADPVARRVYELADSGLSAVQIASMLHEHTGKVELILALRRSATKSF